MQPLVSVMMPVFNMEDSLPLALASLRAQTHEEWEAVVVDDGSTDRTWEILNDFSDPRLKLSRFSENRGRGAARREVLGRMRGEYYAFLDADDWYFPRKLERQLEIFRDLPDDVVAVSGNMVVTAGPDDVRGTQCVVARGTGVTMHKQLHLGPPGLPFPPSMIRAAATRGAQFDAKMRRSQDSDFLLQFLVGRRFALSDEPLYAYSQASAASADKTLEGYRFRLRSYWKHRRQDRWGWARNSALTLGKMGVLQAAVALGTDEALIGRRWGAATPEETRALSTAHALISQRLPG